MSWNRHAIRVLFNHSSRTWKWITCRDVSFSIFFINYTTSALPRSPGSDIRFRSISTPIHVSFLTIVANIRYSPCALYNYRATSSLSNSANAIIHSDESDHAPSQARHLQLQRLQISDRSCSFIMRSCCWYHSPCCYVCSE